MKIEAEVKNIKKILVNDEKFYQIPDYQRPYSWDKDNLSDLIDDLVIAYIQNKDDTYFCGSLVLVENKQDARFDIIDGQQRITTFTILACVFRDCYLASLSTKAKDYINSSIQDKYESHKRKLKFLTNEQYQIDFEETVLKGIDFNIIGNIEKSFPNNRYLQNSFYLKFFLEEKLKENEISDINEFVIWFYENIVMTVISCPSQDSAIQIFAVLNDRGMPLSPIDILKSKLMQTLDNEDRKAFKSKWELVNSNLIFFNFDIDGMLNTYLYYKIATNPESRLDKKLWEVFENEGRSSLEIIKEISDFSECYIKVLTAEDKNVYCLKYLKHKIYWTSILSTAFFSNYNELEDLKKVLVAYYYQNWIAGATVARIKQTSFNILKLVKKGEPISEIKNEINKNLINYTTTNKFVDEIKGDFVYGRKWDRAILLLIEYFLSDDNKQNFIPINDKLNLEHILPITPTDFWKQRFNDEERKKWTNSLANLTLLSMRKNVQAKNSSFEEKLDSYKNKDNVATSFLITQKIFECNDWNIFELEKREEFLVEKIMDRLNIF